MERKMGSKQQPKKYLDSSKNIDGSLTKPKRRTRREEFSDNELLSEDDEDYQDDQEDQQDEDTTNNLGRSHKPNTPSTSKRHDTGNYEVRGAQTTTVDDIAEPKSKKKVPPKSLGEQIFTPVFMYQFFITITCVLLVNYCSVSILSNNVPVSDTSFRSNDKVIDIGRKVQKALDTEMGKADIGGKVQEAIHFKLNNADIDSKVQDAIDIKLPDALNNQVHHIVRDEAESAVKGLYMKRVIEMQVSENSEGIKSDVEQSLSSRIANAFGIVLDKNVASLEEAIGGIAEFFNKPLASFEQELKTAEGEVSKLHDNFKSASGSLKQLSESYSEMSTSRKHDSDKIDKLQTTVQNGEHKLKDMDTELEKLKKTVSNTKSLYEEYKHKVQQLNDIRSRVDAIQPNIFNKDSFITAFMILIVIVLLQAVFVYNLYQRLNNDIPGRTGGRTTAEHRNNLGNNEVLRMIPDGAELEAGVCIISFDESRTATHRRILDSANIPNCRVQVHVVRRHEHIPELPRCKVYLMCTEFSERHVIIEEPGKGLGDLHRTTYGAVVKLGGCLIILYTRDPGSRNLKDHVRYNKNIYCVTNQPELSDLNQDGRFFSVCDDLNNYQKTELRRKITEHMT
ncbi:uncharacterized protein LOC123561039 [Mercenaria mercenaria]|uniref:uncharacterized protein LOC123561039 n=1 Tax=Mercenaria mercenaria TaxID=6596 RepID=UPI00234F47CF|nr:uncharacterized protein LOC123561039 [Mercenaria mercenaria]